MPRERDLKLSKYNITKNRYLELKYFCRQYPEWKRELTDLRCGYKPINLTGLPSGSGTSDAVSDAAIRAAELSKKCELIEQCCIEADSGIYQSLLKNVTEGIPYEHMPTYAGRRQFYEVRRKFFWLLNKKTGNSGDVLM